MSKNPLILLINLSSRNDRLEKMSQRLSAYDFLRIPATTTAEIDTTEASLINKLSPAEIACTNSHIRALEAFLKTDSSSCVILEDDVVLGEYFSKFISQFKEFPENTYVVKLETHLNKFRHSKIPLKIKGLKLNRMYDFHHGAAAYATSRRGANLIINELKKFNLPVDDVIFELMLDEGKYGIAMQLNPACCIQEKHVDESSNMDSDIESDRKVRLEKFNANNEIHAKQDLSTTKVSINYIRKILREFNRIALQLLNIFSLRKRDKIAFKH
jgi:glycosyl transferase family 25